MSTREALHKLTKFDKDKLDDEDEWLVIRVPKKDKRNFLSTFATAIQKMNSVGWKGLTGLST